MDEQTTVHRREPTDDPQVAARAEATSERLSAISSLLENLDEVQWTAPSTRSRVEFAHQNQLIQVRLGIAGSLFTALRAKHAPTASHSLRVALACSSWALSLDISDQQRDEIEVAALLHDIGKIAVPDAILQKPGRLTVEESAIVEAHREFGLEILTGCSASREMLEVVHESGAWFDGNRAGFQRSGDKLPLGARMLSIVDAFDAMTTDHVYRRALARERAIAELFSCAGTQFDPQLVEQFCNLLNTGRIKFNTTVARRWLTELHPASSNALWCQGGIRAAKQKTSPFDLFQRKLVDSMHDGVVFVDATMTILLWNRGAVRLTGVSSTSVTHQRWLPSLLKMRDERGQLIEDDECPVAHVIQSGIQNLRRLIVAGRGETSVSVDAHMVPVMGNDGVPLGATLLLHDASSQITLEETVESLNVKASQDPLTKVANRAEFDRVLKLFVHEHGQRRLPCALIICDLDYFKQVNDNFGHQAGDEALLNFAALLQRHHRAGDLVARYGGEEFVMLCKDCDNATATERAEEIRRDLERTAQPMLNGKCITASFGVTEIQNGDTPETMVRRADRALLQAKDLGRNTVVQLGSGISDAVDDDRAPAWLAWMHRAKPDRLLERQLITSVPLNVVVEKLRGFVADHHAEITKIDDDRLALKIDGHQTGLIRRHGDRAVPFVIELAFDEQQTAETGRGGGTALRTRITVTVRPIRNRDRRRRDVVDRARKLMVSLKSYLMAYEDIEQSAIRGDESDGQSWLQRTRQRFAPFFGRRRRAR